MREQPRRWAYRRRWVFSVDHRFALRNTALVSAPSKKSFSSVNCSILARSPRPPAYDFNDDNILVGAGYWVKLVRAFFAQGYG